MRRPFLTGLLCGTLLCAGGLFVAKPWRGSQNSGAELSSSPLPVTINPALALPLVPGLPPAANGLPRQVVPMTPPQPSPPRGAVPHEFNGETVYVMPLGPGA